MKRGVHEIVFGYRSRVEFGDDAVEALQQDVVKCNARTPRLLGVFA